MCDVHDPDIAEVFVTWVDRTCNLNYYAGGKGRPKELTRRHCHSRQAPLVHSNEDRGSMNSL